MVLLVSLDIEGAFDHAWWPSILKQLQLKGCPGNLCGMVGDYLRGRRIVLRYSGVEHRGSTSRGCIQGSISGPTFWNLILDPLLNDLEALEVHCQAYADDVVLMFSGHTGQQLEAEAERALNVAHAWSVRNKLNFSAKKSKAMILTKKLKYEVPSVSMNGVSIDLVESIKILGLTVDNKLTFNTHVAEVCNKATNLYRQVASTAKVTWGLSPEIVRTIYVAVVEPTVLYAASVWADSAGKLMTKKRLNTVQRGFAQKICKAYRTVSLSAALVLAGLLPLDLRVKECSRIFEVKRGKKLAQLAGREVEQRVSYMEAPHPAKAVTISYEGMETMDEEALLRSDVTGPHIYTDGSRIDDKVGAALTWWRGGVESKSSTFRLESCCTVFQAELFALYKATCQILSSSDPIVNIFSDSKSSLEVLTRGYSANPLAVRTRANIAGIRAEGRDVRLFWVRAHIGNLGNERADMLAKHAALHKKTAASYDMVPLSYARRIIRERMLDEWNERYITEPTAFTTKIFFPDVRTARGITTKLKYNSHLTQMLTGHGGFAEYLHKFKLRDSPGCECDINIRQTLLHLLLDCPIFCLKRLELEMKCGAKVEAGTLHELLENWETRPFLLAFGAHVVDYSCKRNK